jgi:hypothetical protein
MKKISKTAASRTRPTLMTYTGKKETKKEIKIERK